MVPDTMTPRDRFRAVMNFQPFDRLPVLEWAGWWDQTLTRWRGEGLPGDVTDVNAHLGLDLYRQTWFPAVGDGCPQPAHHGAPIFSTMDQYVAGRKHLYPWPVVDRERWRALAQERERDGTVIWITLEGFFWFPRRLLGIEPHLYAFYDAPELIHQINADLVQHQLRIIEEVCSICTPDFMTFAEDLSYNHGPMLSEQLFREFLTPYYMKVVPALRERGIITIADSDGDVTVPMAWFQDAGLDGILPLERQAGVDMARLRRMYPRARFIGAFDKMTMNRGEAAMRAEFERLLPVAARGGFIISCDHQTPPGVSFQDYHLYLRLFREYAREAGLASRRFASG